jgi:hypothetical protein
VIIAIGPTAPASIGSTGSAAEARQDQPGPDETGRAARGQQLPPGQATTTFNCHHNSLFGGRDP